MPAAGEGRTEALRKNEKVFATSDPQIASAAKLISGVTLDKRSTAEGEGS
jgi:hypothetical protein